MNFYRPEEIVMIVCLAYSITQSLRLHVYTDTDWINADEDKLVRRNSGYVLGLLMWPASRSGSLLSIRLNKNSLSGDCCNYCFSLCCSPCWHSWFCLCLCRCWWLPLIGNAQRRTALHSRMPLAYQQHASVFWQAASKHVINMFVGLSFLLPRNLPYVGRFAVDGHMLIAFSFFFYFIFLLF